MIGILKVIFILSVFELVFSENETSITKVVDTSWEFNVPDAKLFNKSIVVLQETYCKRDLRAFIEGVSNFDRWAMTMFDASIKYPSGLLVGNAYLLGNFDECIAVKKPRDDFNNFEVNGQYCLSDIYIRNNLQKDKKQPRYKPHQVLHWAFCVPSTCTNTDVQKLLNEAFRHILNSNLAQVQVPKLNCHYNKELPITNGEIIYASTIGVFLLFVSIATLYDAFDLYKQFHSTEYSFQRKSKSTVHDVLIAFSLIYNVIKVLKVNQRNHSYDLDCICGMRVLSMMIILSGHALLFIISAPAINSKFNYPTNLGQIQNAIFLNNPLLVDTFLLMSGLLMCRLLLLELMRRKGNINFLILYIARLTPAYAVVIGFYCTFLYRIGDGPLWDQKITVERDRCLKSWWSNLLYINNYVSTDNLCMFQSWYLSVDTQLFMIGPFLIYPLWKKRITGMFLLSLFVILTGVIPFLCTYAKKLDPTLLIYAPEIKDLASNYYFKNAYIKTHMRANAYALGILFGYIIHRVQSSGIIISNFIKTLGWLLAVGCGLGSLFSVTYFYRADYEYDVLLAALYSPLHRLAWCFSVGWVILMCVTNTSFWINRLLSWKPFTPFSRLTYCAYLVNGVVELYSYGKLRAPRYLSWYNLGIESTGHVMLTVAIAFVLCVLFESPIHNLEKIILRKTITKERSKKKPEDE